MDTIPLVTKKHTFTNFRFENETKLPSRHTDWIRAFLYLEKYNILVAGGDERQVEVFNTITGELLCVYSKRIQGYVYGFELYGDKSFFCATGGGVLMLSLSRDFSITVVAEKIFPDSRSTHCVFCLEYPSFLVMRNGGALFRFDVVSMKSERINNLEVSGFHADDTEVTRSIKEKLLFFITTKKEPDHPIVVLSLKDNKMKEYSRHEGQITAISSFFNSLGDEILVAGGSKYLYFYSLDAEKGNLFQKIKSPCGHDLKSFDRSRKTNFMLVGENCQKSLNFSMFHVDVDKFNIRKFQGSMKTLRKGRVKRVKILYEENDSMLLAVGNTSGQVWLHTFRFVCQSLDIDEPERRDYFVENYCEYECKLRNSSLFVSKSLLCRIGL